MKKLVATGAVLAMILASSSPAFAQTFIGDEDLFLDASQTQTALAVNAGDANAAADDGSFAFASSGAFVFQGQFNGGF